MSNSLRLHGLYSSWNSPGQTTGAGSHSLCQGIFPTQESNQSLLRCGWILYQMSHKGSPRILQWVAHPSSSRSSWPRNRTSLALQADSLPTELWGKPGWPQVINIHILISPLPLISNIPPMPYLFYFNRFHKPGDSTQCIVKRERSSHGPEQQMSQWLMTVFWSRIWCVSVCVCVCVCACTHTPSHMSFFCGKGENKNFQQGS